jgi:hypothetical protein
MVSGKYGIRQIVKAARTAFTEIPLSFALSIIMSLSGYMLGAAIRTTDSIRPPQFSNHLITAMVID